MRPEHAAAADERPRRWARFQLGPLSAVGIALGLPLAALLGRALSSMLLDVKPLDPVVFTLAPAVLALAAFCATLIPARRATRVNPLTALRGE